MLGGAGEASSHRLPPPRSRLAEAAALYSLVDEQLHVLVTASNHLLGRLELRIRLGRLEAAIRQVKGQTGRGPRGMMPGAQSQLLGVQSLDLDWG